MEVPARRICPSYAVAGLIWLPRYGKYSMAELCDFAIAAAYGEFDMRKILALVATSGSFAFALGLNCIPNVPNLFGDFGEQFSNLFNSIGG